MATDKKIVLITGANQGIGFLTAQVLASSSSIYHVIIGSRTPSKGEQAVKDLLTSSPSSSISTVQLDVTSQSSIQAAASLVEKNFGRLDVLINNAGIIVRNPNLLENLREIFETNTFGPMVVTDAFLPLLEKSQDGKLVYVSSGLGSSAMRADPEAPFYKLPGTTYRMSKSALNMLMICHHVEFQSKGIKVWAFDPGYVVTNLSGTGEAGIQERVKNGAGDPTLSAKALTGIVMGERDADVGKHLDKEGVVPW